MRRPLATASSALVALLCCVPAQAAPAPIEIFPTPEPASSGSSVTLGPEGDLWYVKHATKAAGRVTPAGKVEQFELPFYSGYGSIAAGPDGAVWLTGPAQGSGESGHLARIDAAGALTEPFVPAEPFVPQEMTTGSDGALWITESAAGRIGRLTTSGQFSTFPLPEPKGGIEAIVSGPDGALWFTESSANRVGRMATDGAVTEFPMPASKEGPRDIVSGPGGGLWVAAFGRGSLIELGTDGKVTEFRLPPPLGNTRPEKVAVDRLGDIWAVGSDGSLLRMKPDGSFARFVIPLAARCRESEPCESRLRADDLTEGPGGDIWFAGRGGGGLDTGGSVGRIDVSSPPAVPEPDIGPSLHGSPRIGERLTARVGSWASEPSEFSFAWQLCDRHGKNCSRRPGRGSSIVLGRKDLGHTVREYLAACNDAGTGFARTTSSRRVRGAPPRLAIRIGAGRLALGAGGRVRVPLSCSGGPPQSICAGALKLRVPGRPGPVSRGRYQLGTGTSGRIGLRLDSGIRRELRGAGRRRATAVATLWGGRVARRNVVLPRF